MDKILLWIILTLCGPFGDVNIELNSAKFFAAGDNEYIYHFSETDSLTMKSKCDSIMGDDDFVRQQIVKQDYIQFFKFHYGRFYWKSDFSTPLINIATQIPDTLITIPIWNHVGTEWYGRLEFYPGFDTTGCSQLVNRFGLENFKTIFVLTHELIHYNDYLDAIKFRGTDYSAVREYMRSIPESNVDKRAKEFLLENLTDLP